MVDVEENLISICRELKHRGYAVVVFTPEELRGSDPDRVEEVMVERGWDAIHSLATEEEGEE